MKKNGENREHNFLILIDFSEASYVALKYTISLAKQMKGNIHLFHVADSGKIEKRDTSPVVQCDFSEEGDKIKEKLNSIVEIITAEDVSATYDYSFGDERNEIESQIDFYKPDITIIGRRKFRLNYRGKITSYLLNKNRGCVLIACNSKPFSSNTKISLACNKQTLDKYNLNMVYDLHDSVTPPLSMINILKDPEQEEEIQFMNSLEHFKKEKDRFQFEFPSNLNIAEGLIEKMVQENIELLCIGRSKDTNWILNRFFGRGSTSTNIVKKVDVPILILGTIK